MLTARIYAHRLNRESETMNIIKLNNIYLLTSAQSIVIQLSLFLSNFIISLTITSLSIYFNKYNPSIIQNILTNILYISLYILFYRKNINNGITQWHLLFLSCIMINILSSILIESSVQDTIISTIFISILSAFSIGLSKLFDIFRRTISQSAS